MIWTTAVRVHAPGNPRLSSGTVPHEALPSSPSDDEYDAEMVAATI